MRLIRFDLEKDFDTIKNWITDERTHAMWCANYFKYPLDKENFAEVLEEKNTQYGDTAYIAVLDNEQPVGLFCYSKEDETDRGRLKFVVVEPEHRGKGIAGEMLKLVAKLSFDVYTSAYLDWICVLKNERHNKVAQALLDELRKELKTKIVPLLIALMDNNDEAQRFYKSIEGASIHDQGIWMDI